MSNLIGQNRLVDRGAFCVLDRGAVDSAAQFQQLDRIQSLVDDPQTLEEEYAKFSSPHLSLTSDRTFRQASMPFHRKGIGHLASSLHGHAELEELHTAAAIHGVRSRGDRQKVLLTSWEDLLEISFVHARTNSLANPFSLSSAFYALADNVFSSNADAVTVIVSLFQSAEIMNPEIVRMLPNSENLAEEYPLVPQKLRELEHHFRSQTGTGFKQLYRQLCDNFIGDKSSFARLLAYISLSNSVAWQGHRHTYMKIILGPTDFFGAWSRANWGLATIQGDTRGQREVFCHHTPDWTIENGTFESKEKFQTTLNNPYQGPDNGRSFALRIDELHPTIMNKGL